MQNWLMAHGHPLDLAHAFEASTRGTVPLSVMVYSAGQNILFDVLPLQRHGRRPIAASRASCI